MKKLLASMVIFGSCAIGAQSMVMYWASAAAAQTAASKVEMMGVSDAIKVDRILVKDEGLMQIQAELYNDNRKPITVYYRVKWLDASGFQVWADEAWKPAVIQAFAKQSLQMMAPTPKAKDFQIQVSTSDAKPAPRQGSDSTDASQNPN